MATSKCRLNLFYFSGQTKMNIVKSILSLFAITLFFISCSKEEVIDSEIETDSTETITSKNCNINQSGLTPITDLGVGYYRGYQGGLYPNGSNVRQGVHLSSALSVVRTIKKLKTNGQPDTNGNIVMIGIGASNPRTEFDAFIQQITASGSLRSGVKIINTCIGGQGVQKMNTPTANYWQQAKNTLQQQGLTEAQVQVAWIETDNTSNGDTLFPRAPLLLINDLKVLLETIKLKFPNIKICYLSSRAFSGYALASASEIGKGLLYPRDYYNGWALKWMVEKQINNEPGFTISTIPFITMGNYNWSQGSQPRMDGFFLDCNLDIGSDGLHLTAPGEEKIGALMKSFFLTDTTTYGWLR